MEDSKIVELFWQRSEEAISETEYKYSEYLNSIAFGILRCKEDAEECVDDTFVKAWDAIPPARPVVLRTYLGKITRNLSLNELDKRNTQKRGMGDVPLALSELEECISDTEQSTESNAERHIEDQAITQAVNKFLKGLKPMYQKVFVRRYFYGSEISEIAKDYNFSESKVKSILFRLRKKLKNRLMKEGILQ